MNGNLRVQTAVLVIGLLVFLAGCSQPNQLPTVRITAPQEGVLLGSVIEFRAQASDPDGEIRSYRWDFGDGETSDEPGPTHEYARSGEYRVELVVTDDRDGTARDGITIKVQVGPRAIATVRQAQNPEDVVLQYLSGEAPLTVAFDGSRSTPEPGTRIVKYEWDFGDGETGEGPEPVHIYTRGGEFTVTLTITDDRGRSDQAEVVVKVLAYEPVEETLELGDLTIQYRLHRRMRASPTGNSMIYQYIVDAPRRLTEEEIRAVLREIIERAQARPRTVRITVYLFDRVRENLMIPRDYDHFLGYAIWDLTEVPERQWVFSINRAYLTGTGLPVLGYQIVEDLLEPGDPECGPPCERYRIAYVEIFVQDEPICRELLLNTIREIASWRLTSSFEGFVANIYSRDIRRPLAWALGLRSASGISLEDLPSGLLLDAPGRWDLEDESLRVTIDGDQVPRCPNP